MPFHFLPLLLGKSAAGGKAAGAHHAARTGSNKGAYKAAKTLENGARVARYGNQDKNRKKRK